MENKECKVFKTEVILTVESVDQDCCRVWEDETVYNNVFYSRKNAVRMAQKKFAKYHLNNRVNRILSKVTALSITEKGMKPLGVIYRKYAIKD